MCSTPIKAREDIKEYHKNAGWKTRPKPGPAPCSSRTAASAAAFSSQALKLSKDGDSPTGPGDLSGAALPSGEEVFPNVQLKSTKL